MSIDLDDFLQHYGKKGMRWGVRKKKNNSKPSNDAKRAEYALGKLNKGGTRALSNNELRDLNKRLQLEQQLKNLSPKKNSKIKTGLSFTKEVLNAGQTVNTAITFANSPAGQIIKDNLAKK